MLYRKEENKKKRNKNIAIIKSNKKIKNNYALLFLRYLDTNWLCRIFEFTMSTRNVKVL